MGPAPSNIDIVTLLLILDRDIRISRTEVGTGHFPGVSGVYMSTVHWYSVNGSFSILCFYHVCHGSARWSPAGGRRHFFS